MLRPAPDKAPKRAHWRGKDDDSDWKLFVLSFFAFFTVAYTFML